MRFFFLFLYVSIPITLLCGLLDFTVQQNFRTSANDPQIQLAEDTAAQIASGTQIDQIVPIHKIDIATSLSPYLIVFNNQGVPLLSQATLHGQTPTLPQGVFDITHAYNKRETSVGWESRFTWQPEPGVRDAVVLVHVVSQNGDAYILAGRSLREVEAREQKLTIYVVGAWIIIEILLIGMSVIGFLLSKKGYFSR